jgi:hypothetical protein
MIWFGSSAGVALANIFPQARSVGLWLKHGWHIAIAYVVGFLVMLALLGWHPDTRHNASSQPAPAASAANAITQRVACVNVPLDILSSWGQRERAAQCREKADYPTS